MLAWRLLIALWLQVALVHGEGLPIQLNVSWSDYLSRSDLVWEWDDQKNIPTKWYHSAFLGNGALGMMVRVNDTNPSTTLRFVVSSSAVWDDRENGTEGFQNNFVLDRPRLPVGEFYISTAGEIKKGSMRLVLYNGIAEGEVETTKGKCSFTAFANTNYDMADVMVVNVLCTGDEGKQSGNLFTWHAKPAQSTWQRRGHYIPNPPVSMTKIGNITVALQKHLKGTAHATAFLELMSESSSGYESTLYVSITKVVKQSADQLAAGEVKKAIAVPYDQLLAKHKEWWNNYYTQSFLTFNDTMAESFYWIQMYKLASGTRSDREPYDLMGPWFIDHTGWPDLHWDLNVQLTYYPVYVANRLDLGESLVKLLDNNFENLVNNVPVEYRNDSAAAPSGASSLECKETCYWDHGTDCLITSPTIIGNLMWTCQLYYLQYRYSMNTTFAKTLYPLLRRAVNYYVRIQVYNNSAYHLPVTFSPEYPGRGPDTNYDLALYRWGLEAVIHLAEDVLHVTDEPMMKMWQDSLKYLTTYPVDSNGYRIAATVPFDRGHRHFSHLFMVWPLATINWQNETEVELATKSVDHWIGYKTGLTGFCRPAVAVMSMLLKRPEGVYSNVTFLLNDYILPNTFYHEGENGECGETPPMAASALQDMVVYAVQGVVFVFAGVDDENLANVSFYRLRTEGAYLFSGRRIDGRTDWIAIENDAPSAATEPLLISTDMKPPIAVMQPSKATVTVLSNGFLKVSGMEEPGSNVVIYSQATGVPEPVLKVTPAPANQDQVNYWGLHPKSPVGFGSRELATTLYPDFKIKQHTQLPNTFGFQVNKTMCLMVNHCHIGRNAQLEYWPCLGPGQTKCSEYCDGCEQWWIMYKTHFVSMATGKCLKINKLLEISLHKCPWPVDLAALIPEEPWPWHPQDSDMKWPATDKGIDFLHLNAFL